ncbi:MAG: hypothetical protein Q9192_000437 [Flavoplaca navasiana]
MELGKIDLTDMKHANVNTRPVDSSDFVSENRHLQGQKGRTGGDVLEMFCMGKKQELQRNFNFLSIVGFIMILQSSWESTLLAAYYGLTNGGTGGVIWVTVGVILGALCMIASIGEMASMAPAAGGQFGYFAFLIVLWTMSDHAPASQIFGTFNDGGGWGNTGLSCLVGITTPLWCFLGPDAGAHLSEELKDAGRVLPSVMVWATFFNGLHGLTMIITLCFCIGDIDGVLNSPTGIPIMQVLYNSTGSFTITVIMTTVLIILSMVGTITVIAATSRQMWAFARDKGLPFSSYSEYAWTSPFNAILTTLLVSLLITCLNFGSAVALNAIISLSNAALIFSYMASIGCIRLERFSQRTPPPAPLVSRQMGRPHQ